MRKLAIHSAFLLAISFIIVVPSVFAGDQEGGQTSEDEALVLNLGDSWRLANKKQAANELVLQYLPVGADPKNPSEMITVTSVFGMPAGKDAKTYIIQVRNTMDKAKESAAFDWKLIKDSQDDASCEYTLSGHARIPDQHEIMRVIRGGAEIHTIIYHFGKRNISDTERNSALAIINAVKLTAANLH